MNERIRELALECYNPYGNFDHEKFAKLVAQDCANLCDLYAMPDGTSETAIILARAIRNKFDIE